MYKIAVSGWQGNPERVNNQLQQLGSGFNFEFIGYIKPFTRGYDLILNFGSHPLRQFYLWSCSGKKIIRLCGSDWYRAYFGKKIHRLLLRILGFNICYASQQIKEEAGLPGPVLLAPVNTDLFYPRDVSRDLDSCYYALIGGKYENTYLLETMPEGATLIDGSIPQEQLPELLSRHKKYIRNSLYDANPKLPYEALLCGCQVFVNGEELQDIPAEMLPEVALPKWIDFIRNVLENENNSV